MMAWVALFNLEYSTVTAQGYAYTGLAVSNLPPSFVVITYVLALFPIAWLPLDIRRPSAVVVWWLYLSVVVPSAVIPFHILKTAPHTVLALPISLLIGLALLELVRRSKPISLPDLSLADGPFRVALLAATGLGLGLIALYHGFSVVAPTDLYELRLSSRETLPGATGLAYLTATVKRALGPFLLIFGVARGSWVLRAAGVGTLLLSFTLTGEKTLLALIPVLYGAALVWRRRPNALPAAMIGLTAAMLVVSLAEDHLAGTTIASAYGSRRLLVVPAQVTSYYWDYYSTSASALLSGGIVGRLFTAAAGHTLTPSHTIGDIYFGSTLTNANANIWASGFAAFYYPGIVVVSVVLGMLLRLIDGIGRNRPQTAFLICVSTAPVWADGALHTSLLSQGVLATLLLLYLCPVERAARTTQSSTHLRARRRLVGPVSQSPSLHSLRLTGYQ